MHRVRTWVSKPQRFADPFAIFAISARKTASHAVRRVALQSGDIFSTGSKRFCNQANSCSRSRIRSKKSDPRFSADLAQACAI
jgi:hypothetical protein